MKSIFSLFILLMSINLLAAEASMITSSLSYQELQKLKASDPIENAYFGHNVAIDGNTAVVGAYRFNGYKGRAYIYQYDEASQLFLQKAVLTSASLNNHDSFGFNVAISGGTVIIGANGDDETNTNSGAAYIYEKPPSGNWIDTNETAKLKASDADYGDYFGISVSISGNTVIVGAQGDSETNNYSGAAYIYEKPFSGGWVDANETAKLKASDADYQDNFGISVAISGDTVIIGAFQDDETNGDSGAAYIYEKPTTETGWATIAQENAKLKAPDLDNSFRFGESVAISDDTVIVGAKYDDETNDRSGAAYVYEKPSSGIWVDTNIENAKLKASDADFIDSFGCSVSISGDTVLVGAYYDDEISNASGAAYIYEKPLSGWADSALETAKLKAFDAGDQDFFGLSVAISKNALIIGAKNDDDIHNNSGAIYINKFKNSTVNPAIIMYLLQ